MENHNSDIGSRVVVSPAVESVQAFQLKSSWILPFNSRFKVKSVASVALCSFNCAYPASGLVREAVGSLATYVPSAVTETQQKYTWTSSSGRASIIPGSCH